MREKKNQKDPIKLYKQNQLKVASIIIVKARIIHLDQSLLRPVNNS